MGISEGGEERATKRGGICDGNGYVRRNLCGRDV